MSARFNKFGQWTLGADGGGNTLIKGIIPNGPSVSNAHDKTDGVKGAEAINSTFASVAASILRDATKQPTNEQLFGHLVVTEEMAKVAKEKWNNTFNTLSFKGPVDHLNKSPIDGEWGNGKSFNQLLKGQLSDEEIARSVTWMLRRDNKSSSVEE